MENLINYQKKPYSESPLIPIRSSAEYERVLEAISELYRAIGVEERRIFIYLKEQRVDSS